VTDAVDTVIELPVGALAPAPRRRAPAGRAADDGTSAQRPVAGHRRRAAAVVNGRTPSPPDRPT
jgi:hypothetical protein